METVVVNYQSYLESRKNVLSDEIDRIIEELDIYGYSVVENVLTPEKVRLFWDAIDKIWEIQSKECGEKKLRALREWGTVRALLFYDQAFAELIRHPLVMDVVSRTIGETAILHLMNGIISFPNDVHHQSNLHRDFAKNFVSNKMLSVNAFWTLDAFSKENGATWFLPHTHKIDYTPSDEYFKKHAIQIQASSGSVIFFDSRIYHKGGYNSSSIRIGVNFQYTKPVIKQQMDFPELLKNHIDRESPLAQTLGMWSVPPKSLQEFRVEPEKRTYKPGQG